MAKKIILNEAQFERYLKEEMSHNSMESVKKIAQKLNWTIGNDSFDNEILLQREGIDVLVKIDKESGKPYISEYQGYFYSSDPSNLSIIDDFKALYKEVGGLWYIKQE